MNDAQDVELKVGQKVAVAYPTGTNAAIAIGYITDLNPQSKKFRYESVDRQSRSNWNDVYSYYGQACKVVILDEST